MAFAWELTPTIVGFNLDYPEEVILIQHFVMAHAARPNDEILQHFTKKFFDEGKGVSSVDFDHIIRLAKDISHSCDGLKLRPSGRTDYIETRDKSKAALRQDTRRKLEQRSGADILATAYKDLDRLPLVPVSDQPLQKLLFSRYMRGESAAHEQPAQMPEPPSYSPCEASVQNGEGGLSKSSPPPGYGDQPDMSAVDVLQHMNAKDSIAFGIPGSARAVDSQPETSNNEVLLGIQADIVALNETVMKLIDEVRRLKG
tara:strand:+ start:18345 stop:19115 length:771 start_codon:yes stop_codon:yes gene_type:complete